MRAECSDFKYLIFKKQQAHYHIIDTKISALKMLRCISTGGKESVLQLKKECNSFSLEVLWKSFLNDLANDIYPNMMYLLYLLNIFPISAVCVERLFSKMKLIETCQGAN